VGGVLLPGGQLRIVLVLSVDLGMLEELGKGLRVVLLEHEFGGRRARGRFPHKAGGGSDHWFEVRQLRINAQFLGISCGSEAGSQ